MSSSNQKSLLNLLEQEFETGENADVEIHVGRRKFKASKFLLCLQSPVLKTLLECQSTAPSKQMKVLKINNFDANIIESMLRYIYTSKAGNLKSQALDMFKVANYFGLQGLRDECLKNIHKNLSISNIFDCLDLIYINKMSDLKYKAMQFIAQNQQQVVSSQKWSQLSKDVRLDVMETVALYDLGPSTMSSGYNLSLSIDPPIGHVLSSSLNNTTLYHRLKNNGNVRLAFRVLYSTNSQFLPRPANGFIGAGKEQQLEISGINKQLLPYMISVLYTEAANDEQNAWALFDAKPKCKNVDLILHNG